MLKNILFLVANLLQYTCSRNMKTDWHLKRRHSGPFLLRHNVHTLSSRLSVSRVNHDDTWLLLPVLLAGQSQRGQCLWNFIPRSHSYCLSLPLCLKRYNGSITPRVHSDVPIRIQCSYTTDRPQPWNKCVKPQFGVYRFV